MDSPMLCMGSPWVQSPAFGCRSAGRITAGGIPALIKLSLTALRIPREPSRQPRSASLRGFPSRCSKSVAPRAVLESSLVSVRGCNRVAHHRWLLGDHAWCPGAV